MQKKNDINDGWLFIKNRDAKGHLKCWEWENKLNSSNSLSSKWEEIYTYSVKKLKKKILREFITSNIQTEINAKENSQGLKEIIPYGN